MRCRRGTSSVESFVIRDMSRFRYRVLVLVLVAFGGMIAGSKAHGFSLALDSIAAMGKFPKFCIDVYRWGDRFFNSYDTAYVEGTGFKFNVKNRTETWSDRYLFGLPNDYELQMASDQCTSTGIYLTYLAVSFGYDLNVSKIFGSRERARNRFVFSFNCALFSVDMNWVSNNVASNIRKFGPENDLQSYNYRFDGINTDMFSISAVYFLNNKRYSQASAFNYSKIQKRNQGSFFIGFNYWTQNFEFDFSDMPQPIKVQLPTSWSQFDYKYQARNRNYALAVGYGFNWVFAKNWVLGISESPNVGLKSGYINYVGDKKYSFSLFNRARGSIVWNNRHWFAGGILKVDNTLIYDKDHSLLNTVINGEVSVGYRFNLW